MNAQLIIHSFLYFPYIHIQVEPSQRGLTDQLRDKPYLGNKCVKYHNLVILCNLHSAKYNHKLSEITLKNVKISH